MFKNNYKKFLATTAIDSDAQAWKKACGDNVSDYQLNLVSNLIKQLKLIDCWDSLDRLWLHASENTTQALVDIKTLATATAVNSPVFTSYQGYTTNGTSSYLNLNLAANATGKKYTLDNASFGGWKLISNSGGIDFGYDYGGYSMIMAMYGATAYRWEINSATNPSGTPASSGNSAGFFHSQRTSSTVSKLWRNGISTITSSAVSSGPLPNKNFGVGAYISSGASNFAGAQYSISFIGASLAGRELDFYNALQIYMQAIGIADDVDVNAWVSAVRLAGGAISSARLLLINNLVTNLKSAGVWGLTDDIWLLAAENAVQALISLKQLRTATAVNSPTFTTDRGYTFNGTTNYINTGFIPGTHAVVMTGTNLRAGTYETTNLSGSSTSIGAVNFSTQCINIIPRNPTDLYGVQLDNQATGTSGTSVTDSRGLFAGSRNVTDIVGYKNGNLITPAAAGILGSVLPTATIYIGAYQNNAGAAANFRGATEALGFVGASLTATQELIFYNVIQAHMTAIGANV